MDAIKLSLPQPSQVISRESELPLVSTEESSTTVMSNHNSVNKIPLAWKENKRHHMDERVAKNDDAGIPIHFWNDALAARLGISSLSESQEKALMVLQEVFGQ